MKKLAKKLQLHRETVQNLIEGPTLRAIAAGGTNNALCTRLGICTQTCGHICP
jgi:hypothetical protein